MKHKVIIFINSLRTGGAERVVSHLLAHMKDDFEIHLALYNRSIDYEIPPEVKIFDMKQAMRENIFLIFLKLPLLSYKLYRYCKKNKIETSVAFLNRPCYINALLRSIWRFKGCIVMCERTHQTTILKHNKFLYRFISRNMVKFAYSKADVLIANSYEMKADIIDNFHVKVPVQVIHNPIDLHHIRRQMHKKTNVTFEEGHFHFISVGGFRKEKNYDALINSFYMLKHLPVKLLIVGGGVLEKSIRAKVHDLGLSDRVIFAGFDNNPFKYLRKADCFVLTSYVEGFPNVLLEALACGVPIISTDCKSGPREILAPGTDLSHKALSSYETAEFGMLTPVHDVSNLAAAMTRMYEDGELRAQYRKRAKERAESFDISKIKRYFHVAFSG